MEETLIRCFCAAAAALMLSACATQYQSSGLTGGHYETAGPGKLEKVHFSGNGYITSDVVQKYAMYRCAEIAKKKGKPHFVIYDGLMAAALDRTATLPRVGAVGNKPTAAAFLLLLDRPREGSHETQAVLAELASVVNPPVAASK